jgi:hypothetical protein
LSRKRAEPTERVFVALTSEELPFTAENGRVTAVVPKVYAHAVVVFE